MNGLFVIVIIAILSIRIKHKSADHMKKTLLHNILDVNVIYIYKACCLSVFSSQKFSPVQAIWSA